MLNYGFKNKIKLFSLTIVAELLVHSLEQYFCLFYERSKNKQKIADFEYNISVLFYKIQYHRKKVRYSALFNIETTIYYLAENKQQTANNGIS